MPEFPDIGWDELPPLAHDHDQPHEDVPHNDQNVEQQELVDENQVDTNQSQESVILQVSDFFVDDDDPVAHVVIYQPPAAPMQHPLHIG